MTLLFCVTQMSNENKLDASNQLPAFPKLSTITIQFAWLLGSIGALTQSLKPFFVATKKIKSAILRSTIQLSFLWQQANTGGTLCVDSMYHQNRECAFGLSGRGRGGSRLPGTHSTQFIGHEAGVEIKPNFPLARGMSSPEKLLVPKKNH